LVRWQTSLRPRLSLWQTLVLVLAGCMAGAVALLIASAPAPLPAGVILLATLALLAGLIAAATGHLRQLLLAIMLVEIPLQIDVYLGWVERAARFNAIAGFNLSLTTLILISLYAWWAVEVLSRRTAPPSRAVLRDSLPSLAYFAAVALSITVARDLTFAMFGLNLVVQALLMYFYIANFTRTRTDVLFIWGVLLVSLLIQSAILIALGARGRSVEIGIVSTGHVTAGGRPGGTLTSPNVAGAYVGLALLTTFSLLTLNTAGWRKLLAGLAVGAGGLALLATGSRGSWGGLAIALVLFCLLTWRQGWLSLKIPMAYVVLALLLAAVFYEPILNRLLGESAVTSAESRGPLTLLALRMIRDHPWLGVGVNNFVFHLKDYVSAEFSGLWITTVHNKYLLVWAESGLLGLLTFVWFLVATLRQGWQIWKRQDRLLAPLALAFSLAIVAWMIHMTVELYNSRIQLLMLWLMAGVITAMAHMPPDRPETGPPA
jgi:O-antigen ligase